MKPSDIKCDKIDGMRYDQTMVYTYKCIDQKTKGKKRRKNKKTGL